VLPLVRLIFKPSHRWPPLHILSEDAPELLLWFILLTGSAIHCLKFYLCRMHTLGAVFVSLNLCPGFMTCGRYGLILQLEMQVCC
jgi:hypothetical protein